MTDARTMRHLALFTVAPLAAALALATPAGAQGASVVGVVRDSTDAPIAGATVWLSDHRARTDSAGRFVVRGVGGGSHELRVWRLGFRAHDQTLGVRGDGTDSVRVTMAAAPRPLPAVVTRGTRACAKFDYAGLRCRKADGRGLVLTIEDLDARRPEYLADVLSELPGIRVHYANSNFGPAQVPSTPARCMVTLIAGMTSYKTWSPWDLSSVKDVVGIEVYRPNEIPPEYRHEARRGGESCWLVNVWTWGNLKV